MSLIRETADDVEDVAAGFRGYREPLPEHAAEITSLIADLYGISAYLNSIDGAARSRQFPQNFVHIQDDLELLRSSLSYTLDDIVLHFRQLERHVATLNPYKRTWADLHAFFFNESGHYLPLRLQKYKIFLKELENIMQKYAYNIHLYVPLLVSLLPIGNPTYYIANPQMFPFSEVFAGISKPSFLNKLTLRDSIR
jgi:hypothetical protein